MAQSLSESRMRGVPPFWQNRTIEPPIPWEEWSDMFQLALIAKENIDINNLLNPSDRKIVTPATFEKAPDSKSADKAARLARNIEEKRRYEDEENALIKSKQKYVWLVETRVDG